MDNELVHILCGIRKAEAGNSIATTFGGAEGDVEQRDIRGGEDGEVVGHLYLSTSREYWFRETMMMYGE